MYSKELLKGTLRTIVLQLLREQERLYGYEITQMVRKKTGDKIQLTEGALYPTLHKLVAEGLLQTESEYHGKRLRKYYSLTQAGQTAASDRVAEFADFVQTMERLLGLKPS
ncbi:MAG: PadR family transcriptional regulator [Bacteroidota bacterium]